MAFAQSGGPVDVRSPLLWRISFCLLFGIGADVRSFWHCKKAAEVKAHDIFSKNGCSKG
jgi:hypothetical protein